MKAALCIAGNIRTFARKSVRESFERMMIAFDHPDVFIVFKFNDTRFPLHTTETFLFDFAQTIRLLKPKKVLLFGRFAAPRVDRSAYASQVCQINMVFLLAKHHSATYTHFIRCRPDFVLLDTITHPTELDADTIYTTRKCDAKGSDQFFVISAKQLTTWWEGKVRLILPQHIRKTPEYIIFNGQNVVNGPHYYGGLLRPRDPDWDLRLWDDDRRVKALDNNVITSGYAPVDPFLRGKEEREEARVFPRASRGSPKPNALHHCLRSLAEEMGFDYRSQNAIHYRHAPF